MFEILLGIKLKYKKSETCSLIYLQHSIMNSLKLLFYQMNELLLGV